MRIESSAMKPPTPAHSSVSVHLLPGLIPSGALAGGVAVVVDVLRASTVMVQALASGCEAIVPCLEIEEARRTALALPTGSAILAGERQGLPIEGFDLGNSPDSFTPEVCRGKTLVMTTTNGTRAILASLEADRVLVAAFSNIGATLGALLDDPRPLHIVCSGTDGRISFEDSLLAGGLAATLIQRGRAPGNDEATLTAHAWRWDEGLVDPAAAIRHALTLGRGGQRVRELGLLADLDAASRFDHQGGLVAELRRDPIRIVASPSV
ncbi:2-phosphosulfolactate phosphatase family protein [soil metagenome]